MTRLAAVWQLCAGSGASLAVGVGHVLETARAEQATRHVVAAELASARATARMLGVMPVMVLVAGQGLGAEPWPFLLDTLPGLACLAAGAGCALAGCGGWTGSPSAPSGAPREPRADGDPPRPGHRRGGGADRRGARASLLAVRRPAAARLAGTLGARVARTGGRGARTERHPDALGRLRAGGGARGRRCAPASCSPGGTPCVGALLAGVLVWRHSAGWEDRGVRRRREQLEAEVVHVVDLLSAAVTAGAAPAYALHEVTGLLDGVTARHAAALVAPAALGLRAGRRLEPTWPRTSSSGRLGQVLLRSATSGAPVSEALARLAEDERDRQRGQVEARVRQIEVKAAAPLGLCLLPAFVLLGIVPLIAGSVTGLVLR